MQEYINNWIEYALLVVDGAVFGTVEGAVGISRTKMDVIVALRRTLQAPVRLEATYCAAMLACARCA